MSDPLPDGGFFPVVYDELRRLASAQLAGERAGHTLDATALVHEAYLRLGDAAFADRAGFLRAAVVSMQRILVDHARRKRAAKRGGYANKFALDEADREISLTRANRIQSRSGLDPTSMIMGRDEVVLTQSIDRGIASTSRPRDLPDG
jgi:RNA polymerase sigma factor (TIGR02999 family)